jgi:hypothetical protein
MLIVAFLLLSLVLFLAQAKAAEQSISPGRHRVVVVLDPKSVGKTSVSLSSVTSVVLLNQYVEVSPSGKYTVRVVVEPAR